MNFVYSEEIQNINNMKTIIITLIFTFFITCVSFAQPTEGTYVVGGHANFGYSKPQSDLVKSQRTNFTISPSIGKFISEKYQIAFGLGYSHSNRKEEMSSGSYFKQTAHSFSIRFATTRYFPIADKLYFTLEAAITPSYDVNFSKTEYIGVENQSNNISARLNISPGLTYFINKKWMLYSSIGVLWYDASYNTETELIGHEIQTSLSPNSFGLGARYIIGAKSKTD